MDQVLNLVLLLLSEGALIKVRHHALGGDPRVLIRLSVASGFDHRCRQVRLPRLIKGIISVDRAAEVRGSHLEVGSGGSGEKTAMFLRCAHLVVFDG